MKRVLQGSALVVSMLVAGLSALLGPRLGLPGLLFPVGAWVVVLVAASALAQFTFDQRFSDRTVFVGLRSWGLLVEYQRIPWDQIDVMGRDGRTFSIVTRAGRHHRFQDDPSVAFEIAEAFERAVQGQEDLPRGTVEALQALTRDHGA